VSSDRVRLVIGDEGAVYPVEIDPILNGAVDALLEADQASASLG
jgi:hypothetical protein